MKFKFVPIQSYACINYIFLFWRVITSATNLEFVFSETLWLEVTSPVTWMEYDIFGWTLVPWVTTSTESTFLIDLMWLPSGFL